MTIFRRKYKDYNEYLKHQSSKLSKALKKNKRRVIVSNRGERSKKFQKILKGYVPYMIEGKVLCLGARNGAEVIAFRNMGFKDAIGIDLNPGKDNEYVIKGDFHNMEFEDNSFHNVFTNSLDHIFDIRKLSKEISRVMVVSGRLVLEISHFIKGKDMKYTVEDAKLYESFCIDSFEDIKEGFEEFKVIKKYKNKEENRLIVVLKNKKEV